MEGYRLDWESGSGGQGRNRELWHLGMCRSWLNETEMNNNLGRMNITHESSGLGRNFFQELKKKKRGWKVVSKEWFHVIEISRNPLATPPQEVIHAIPLCCGIIVKLGERIFSLTPFTHDALLFQMALGEQPQEPYVSKFLMSLITVQLF